MKHLNLDRMGDVVDLEIFFEAESVFVKESMWKGEKVLTEDWLKAAKALYLCLKFLSHFMPMKDNILEKMVTSWQALKLR